MATPLRQLTRETVCATGFGAEQVEREGQPNGRFSSSSRVRTPRWIRILGFETERRVCVKTRIRTARIRGGLTLKHGLIKLRPQVNAWVNAKMHP